MNDFLVDAIGNLDSDIIERYFKTKEAFNKKKRNAYVPVALKKWVPLAASVALIISSIFAIVIPTISENQEDVKVPSNTDNVIDLPNTNNPSTDIPSIEEVPSDAEENEEYTTWNGLKISWELYDALQEAEDSQALTLIVGDSNIESFYEYVYEGKTYAEYEKMINDLNGLHGKLYYLIKEGEILKNNPYKSEGECYSKEYFDERIEYYGEEIINTYIVDGEFLKEKLEKRVEELGQELDELYALLDVIRNKCYKDFAEEHYRIFEEAGYNVELKERVFWLYITKSDFASLSVDKTQYRFDIVSTEPYDSDKPVDC